MNLKKYLALKDCNQSKVSKGAGVNLSSLNRHLNDIFPLSDDNTIRVAKYLGITEQEVKNNEVKVQFKTRSVENE